MLNPLDALNGGAVVLTPRERQVVSYLKSGLSNKVVAIELDISLRTAEAHRARIYRKLGVRNTVELACKLCRYRCRSAAS
jgi:DNA-binding NarL/FixJ family response regulator